ncbi:MAG: hypothetical protein ACYC5O_02245 [Anaerolineae bacterium]
MLNSRFVRCLVVSIVCAVALLPLPACAPVPEVTPGVGIVEGGTPVATPTQAPPAGVCGLTPYDLSGWRGYLDLAKVDPTASTTYASYVRAGQALFPSWSDVDAAAVAAILTDDPADLAAEARRELAVLGLNVVSGRLNRATEIDADCGAGTVGALITALEQALATGQPTETLVADSQALTQGSSILAEVCLRLVTSEGGGAIIETTWTGQGFTRRQVAQLPQSADSATQIAGLHPSPDYRYAVVETAGHDAGGPLQLLDLTTGDIVDLNRQLGLAIATSGAASALDSQEVWQVIGWHPDGSHLLVTAEGQEAVYWLDIGAGTYERIALPDGPAVICSERSIGLRQDGGAFVYVDSSGGRLRLFDLATREASVLLGPLDSSASIEFPRFSPDGASIAVLVGSDGQGAEYTLELLDPATGTTSIVAQGDLGLAPPLWSHDGQWLAYSRGGGSTTEVPTAPDAAERFRFLWAFSPASQATRLLATVGSDIRQVAWAPNCNLLAYSVEGASIGFCPFGEQSPLWQAGDPIATSVSDAAFFIP